MASVPVDLLDNQNYNPVSHLNALFGTSSHLSQLNAVQNHVELYKSYLDLKQSQPEIPTQNEKESITKVHNSPSELKLLLDEVRALREKAGLSEKTISDMTSDIEKLDNTKSNLIKSITVLKRLQMLTTAYDQLTTLVKTRQYKEMSMTLPAVTELMSHFKSFRSISQIATLSKQISDIQTKIADQILADFALVIEKRNEHVPNRHEIASGLADACLVLESLSGNYKEQVINWYCAVQLREYRNIFKSDDEAGSLENISRRYAYLKRLLKNHSDELTKYFTPSWNVSEELSKSFCSSTREDIVMLLKQAGRNINVQLLLTALEATLEFEAYLEKKFQMMNEESDETFKYGKAISLAFQPHLNIWIEHQDKILSSKINQYKQPPTPASPEENRESITVLPSSADLFIFYRQVLAQTTKLSTGPPLLDLSNLFAKWLIIYSNQILRPIVPSRLTNEDQSKTVCLALSTADYCFTTTSQLEERLLSQLDENLRSQVNLENAKQGFLDIINTSIASLVLKVQTSCDHTWREMANTNWSKLESVGDQSSYVSELTRCVEAETKAMLDRLSKDIYCRMICDKIVEAIIFEFLQNAARCKPISEVAAEQMLLDLYVLKNSLLKLPLLKAKEESQEAEVSSVYTRYVTRSLSKVETIFKVILTQREPPEGLVQNYFYLIGDSSVSNLTKILELKGIVGKSDQARFIELFNSHLKAHDNLIPESIILKNLQLTSVLNNSINHSRTSSQFSQPNFPLTHQQTSPSLFDPPKLGSSLLSKEGFEKGFERFAHGTEVNKLNENFRNIGRLFRRDGSGNSSPLNR